MRCGDGFTARICSGSRLHFGLLDTVHPFGGVGVMLEDPLTEVVVSTAEKFQCPEEFRLRCDPIAERIRDFRGDKDLPPCRVEVPRHAPSHCGLGSGTQLSLAVAEGICRHQAVNVEFDTIANSLAGRAKRSVVGCYGYLHGGVIYETGNRQALDFQANNGTHQTVRLPSQWHVAVLKPVECEESVSGRSEREKFAELSPAPKHVRRELDNLAVNGILAAAKCRDFDAFCESTRSYNMLSGQLFASVQGGTYNGTHVTRVIDWLHDQGVSGYGQSSWGPGVFAWFESEQTAETCLASLPADIELVVLTTVRNAPRSIRVLDCCQ